MSLPLAVAYTCLQIIESLPLFYVVPEVPFMTSAIVFEICKPVPFGNVSDRDVGPGEHCLRYSNDVHFYSYFCFFIVSALAAHSVFFAFSLCPCVHVNKLQRRLSQW